MLIKSLLSSLKHPIPSYIPFRPIAFFRLFSSMSSAILTLPSGKEYIQPTGLFINNAFVPAKSGRTFDTVNPSTSQVICSVEEADAADVDVAVLAARAAFDGAWGQLTPDERGKYLTRLAELIEEHAELLAAVEAFDGGKVLL
jgi:aldehyde dehydrogenase (NAD+)